MDKEILEYLYALEKERYISILYACESGSRAWGFESPDSDWDIRFIYKHNYDWYFDIQQNKKDCIDTTEGLLDFSGWELRKTLGLFNKGNPHLLEYLRSPYTYIEADKCINQLRGLLTYFFNAKRTTYHYVHMARGNYNRYLQDDIISHKKYLYVIRPILACKWIEAYSTAPPVRFETLVESLLEGNKYKHLKEEIYMLLERKKAASEMAMGSKLPALHDFLGEEIIYYQKHADGIKNGLSNIQKQYNIDTLNDIFRGAVIRDE